MISIRQLKQRHYQRFKYRKHFVQKLNQKFINDFNTRIGYQGGVDRQFDDWQIIDIHEIPPKMLVNDEVDFWCCNGKSVFLLRLRNWLETKFTICSFDLKIGTPIYLIAELPMDNPQMMINDEFLHKLLTDFTKC